MGFPLLDLHLLIAWNHGEQAKAGSRKSPEGSLVLLQRQERLLSLLRHLACQARAQLLAEQRFSCGSTLTTRGQLLCWASALWWSVHIIETGCSAIWSIYILRFYYIEYLPHIFHSVDNSHLLTSQLTWNIQWNANVLWKSLGQFLYFWLWYIYSSTYILRCLL